MGKQERRRHLPIRMMAIWGAVSLMLSLTACGSGQDKSGQIRTMGIDGYVYVAEKISGDEIPEDGSLASLIPGHEAPEVSFYPANIYVRDGEGNYYFLSRNYTISVSPGNPWDGALNIYVPGCNYIIYPDGSLLTEETGREDEISLDENPGEKELARVRSLAHTTIYKTSPQGEVLYELDLTQQLWGMVFPAYRTFLAVHKSGTLMLLLEDGILLVDAEGRLAGKLDTEAELRACFPDGYLGSEQYLAGGMDGSIYYVAANGSDLAVFEVVGEKVFSLSRVEALRGKGYGILYPGLEGILFSCYGDGILYGYTGENGLVPILRWQDSSLYQVDVKSLLQISEDEILVGTSFSGTSERAYYRLKRTAVADLPEKEVVVLVSRLPDVSLQKAVTEFNVENQKYHVVLGDYGWDSDYSAAVARLDADLVGSDPPDILDMTHLSFYKYAGNGMLEDLGSYLEGSGQVNREDFLGNVLDACTVDGSLVCIPTDFFLMTLLGRERQFGNARGWTMEECMEFTERYPEYCLMQTDAGNLLTDVCREYSLTRFVDWNKRTCSFDSADFKEMLAWLKANGEKTDRLGGIKYGWEGWQDSLLQPSSLTGFTDLGQLETSLAGEELTPVGYPTQEGEALHIGYVRNALALVSNSSHKEGAWAFVEYFLSRERRILETPGFPVNKKEFQELVEYYTTPDYILDENGEKEKNKDGTDAMLAKFWRNGEPVYYLEEEEIEEMLRVIEETDFSLKEEREDAVMEIIKEEAALYFGGSKGIDETADIIQNRVSVLLGEG